MIFNSFKLKFANAELRFLSPCRVVSGSFRCQKFYRSQFGTPDFYRTKLRTYLNPLEAEISTLRIFICFEVHSWMQQLLNAFLRKIVYG